MALPFNKTNDRIFWVCQAVFLVQRNTEAESEPTESTYLTGVQSIGISSSPEARVLTDVGRMQRKFIQYNQTTYEITLERKIDKSSNFFYNVASGQYNSYANSHILNANNLGFQGLKNSQSKCLRNFDITILYRPDRFKNFSDTITTPITDNDNNDVISVTYKNCLITNISYSISIDGGISESISLITNNMRYNDDISTRTSYTIPSFPQYADILKGEDIDFLNPTTQSLLPKEVEFFFNLGLSGATGQTLNNKIMLGIQSIDISVGIDYSSLTDVGAWRGSEDGKEYEQNRWKYINLPIDITCSFKGIARQSMPFSKFLDNSLQDIRNVDNIFTKSLGDKTSTQWQEADREIRIVAVKNISGTNNYFVWDLGSSNYLTELNYSGGDAGGGNVETTISYKNNFNEAVFTKTTSVINLKDSKTSLGTI